MRKGNNKLGRLRDFIWGELVRLGRAFRIIRWAFMGLGRLWKHWVRGCRLKAQTMLFIRGIRIRFII